jgi:hypothetical protein
MAFPGRLETERLVRALRSVVVFEYPEQQIGHPRLARSIG